MAQSTSESVVIYGCGDVGPIHEPMDQYSVLARDKLAEADLRIGQCERLYSTRGELQVHAGTTFTRLAPGMASVFTDCGFDVVSLASNHAMDWGPNAMLETIDVFAERGIVAIGAGANLEEARKPAIVERNGVRVAVLAYCTVLREGYAATGEKAGVAPLRAHTYYEAQEYQAGTVPRIVTVPYEEDVAMMTEDIHQARQQADVVIIWPHWGIHFVPRVIADYQRTMARAAFEAGADLILGTHAHLPKAVEVFDQGKVCFYSLSNFIMSCPPKSPAYHHAVRYGVEIDPDYPRMPYGVDAKRSLVACARASKQGIESVWFRPVVIDTDLRPEILKSDDVRFADQVQYMEWASEGFDHEFKVDGDAVFVYGSGGVGGR